ncbi:MAG: hypothetical protein MUF81_16725 [Verrucomicrobia bacterium]|nr:hypothetical protein [Verrucomicrobiota bacterium]
MSFVLHPWQLLLVILAGWVNQQQQQIIDFQRTESDVLKEKLGKKRIILNDDQRCRLAVTRHGAHHTTPRSLPFSFTRAM